MRWLHLSDLHFGDNQQHSGLDRSRVLSALLDDVKQQLATAEPLDAVFVTGDVAWAGTKSDYEAARAWFALLLQAATVKNKIPELYWVPGNHDLDRTQVTKNALSKAVHDQARQTRGELEGLWGDDNSRAYLTKKFDCYQAAFGAFEGQPFWEKTQTTDLGPVRILGLNSALLSYNNQDEGQLRLGHQQLLALRSPALTIVLQHHPPSWLADGEDELNDLASQPHLMLSGHEHDGQGFLTHRMGRGEIFRVQAPAGHARDVQVFGYLLGELTTEGLKVWARIWADGPFVNDTARFGDLVPARSKLSEAINKVLHPPPTGDRALRLNEFPGNGPKPTVANLPKPITSAPEVKTLREAVVRHLRAEPRLCRFLVNQYLRERPDPSVDPIELTGPSKLESQDIEDLATLLTDNVEVMLHALAQLYPEVRERELASALEVLLGYICWALEEMKSPSSENITVLSQRTYETVELAEALAVGRPALGGRFYLRDGHQWVVGRSALVAVMSGSHTDPTDLKVLVDRTVGDWLIRCGREPSQIDAAAEVRGAYLSSQAARFNKKWNHVTQSPFYLILEYPREEDEASLNAEKELLETYPGLRLVYLEPRVMKLAGKDHTLNQVFSIILNNKGTRGI